MNQRFIDVFREVFDNPNLVINQNTIASDIEGWDSFNHVNLMIALETEFKIKFSTDEIASFKNVHDIMTSITKKGSHLL